MTAIRIPFNKPYLAGTEFGYIAEAISGGHASGDGPFTRKCSEILASLLGVEHVLLTTSCTDALEMAAILIGIGEGDEVIVPSFTFVSTANAFALHGARPVFVDIRPDTLNLDERQLASKITPRTRAIVPVHYAGVGCAMEEILAVANQHGIHVVEDNAHGLLGTWRGRALGTFGTVAAQSFHETKNFACGEGGALVINDPALFERAEIIREKGTNRNRFYRGQVDKYTWVDFGSSFLMSDLLAAYLYGQLMARRRIQAARKRLWDLYRAELAPWAEANGVRLPCIPPQAEQPYHMFYLLLPSLEPRTAFLQHMRNAGILAVFHYQPLHLSDMGRHFGGRPGDCPIAEDMSDRIVRLPFYTSMTEDEQIDVIEAVCRFAVAQ